MSEPRPSSDSISSVIRQAVLRGIATWEVRREAKGVLAGSKVCDEEIIGEILKLSQLVLEKADHLDFRRLFEGTNLSGDSMLKSKELSKVRDYCNNIQKQLNSQELVLKVSWKCVWGLGTTIGGGVSIGGAATAAALNTVLLPFAAPIGAVAGAVALVSGIILLATANEVECSNYQKVLKGVVENLLKALTEDKKVGEVKKKQLTSALNSTLAKYNVKMDDALLEGVVLNTYSEERGPDQFLGRYMDSLTDKSKGDLENWFGRFQAISNIRKLFAQQCYIGIVGLQNAGKTTLLNKLWHAGEETGGFIHTEKAMIYELDQRVLVVDFPGTNSLDSHAKTFANCGPISNLIIVVVRFDGDISRQESDQIGQAFIAMAGSATAKVLLCVNQCFPNLPAMVQNELSYKEDPVDFLRQHYAQRLNEHGLGLSKKNIMFTDWLATEEQRRGVNIAGVEHVRMRIREYLKDHGIFKEMDGTDRAALDRCIHARLK